MSGRGPYDGGNQELGGCTHTNYMYIYIYIFLAPDNGSQGLFNPIAMTVQKLVKLHRRERLVERGERREV